MALGGGSPPAGLALGAALLIASAVAAWGAEACPACTDKQPGGDLTCEEQVARDKCSLQWMVNGNFCGFSCGRCGCPEGKKGGRGKGGGVVDGPVFTPAPRAVPDPLSQNRTQTPRRSPETVEATVEDPEELPENLLPISELEDGPGQCTNTLLNAIQKSENLSDLATALDATRFGSVIGLGSVIPGEDVNFTLFAPTNEAFGKLLERLNVSEGELTRDYMRELQAIVGYHIVSRPLNKSRIEGGGSISTLAGVALAAGDKMSPVSEDLEIEGVGSNATTNGGPVRICGSAVYLINNVLLPAANLGEIVGLESGGVEAEVQVEGEAEAPFLPAQNLDEGGVPDGENAEAVAPQPTLGSLNGTDNERTEGEDAGAVAPQPPRVGTVGDLDGVENGGAGGAEVGESGAAECDPGSAPRVSIDEDHEISRFSVMLTEVKLYADPTLLTANFTVFAPTNDAFEDYEAALGVQLPNDIDALRDMLLAHIVQGGLEASELRRATNLTSINGNAISIAVSGDVIVLIAADASARILEADIDTSCGSAVHKIDAVLMPPAWLDEGAATPASPPRRQSPPRRASPPRRSQSPPPPQRRPPPPPPPAQQQAQPSAPLRRSTPSPPDPTCSLWQAIDTSPDLRLLSRLVVHAGVAAPLQNPSLRVTLFAPTDRAWQSIIPEGSTLEDLVPEPRVADVILSYHFAVAPVLSKAFKDGSELPTLLHRDGKEDGALSLVLLKADGAPAGFSINGSAGGAQFEQPNIVACTSVIHIIDSVLLPDDRLRIGDGNTADDIIAAAASFDPKIKATDEGASPLSDAADFAGSMKVHDGG